MEIKVFRGTTQKEVLQKIRAELGDDAVLLGQAKTVNVPGFMGFGKKTYIELTATRDVGYMSAPQRPKKTVPVSEQVAKAYSHTAAVIEGKKEEKPAEADMSKYHAELFSIKKDMGWIKDTLEGLAKRSKIEGRSKVSEEYSEIYTYLMEQEIADDIAVELISVLKEKVFSQKDYKFEDVSRCLKQSLSEMMDFCEPIKLREKGPSRVVLVGPTGVGKTTTVAKLAAQFSLQKKKKVSVITADTYRIAAVDQLTKITKILEIPLYVVRDASEVRQALAQCRDSDLILVDTAGRSQNNSEHMTELKSFLAAVDPDETHLVLSMTANQKNILNVIDKFSEIKIDKLLFTKLDEAVNFGIVVNILSKVKTAISYFADGQSIPDDISPADPMKIATDLIKGMK